MRSRPNLRLGEFNGEFPTPQGLRKSRAFRKSWGTLRRLDLEVEDPEFFDEEANAWIPAQAYYARYHAILGFAAASAQLVPRDHAAALRLAGKEVVRGALPAPWDAWCDGCPHTGSHRFGGLLPSGDAVHVLSSPDPVDVGRPSGDVASDDSKEGTRSTVSPGATARYKARAHATEPQQGGQGAHRGADAADDAVRRVWRIRKKANYEDADTFVLGADDETDARRLAQALVIVTDGTVAALEGLAAAYVGPELLAATAQAYADRTQSGPKSTVRRRALSWQQRLRRAASR